MRIYSHFLFNVVILSLLMILAACEDSDPQDPGNSDGIDSTSTPSLNPTDDISPAESAGILGKWELIEKRIPTPIRMSGTFFIFSSEGKLTISNPEDPELEDLTIPFVYEDSSLSFNQDFKLIHISGDSMVLEGETDGLREVNILKRR